jgi:predicted transcriptional regulator
MAKRERLEIIRDILLVIREHNNSIKTTPLLRKSNMSTERFKKYYSVLLEKEFVKEIVSSNNEKHVILTDKGFLFLENYGSMIKFIEEFEL